MSFLNNIKHILIVYVCSIMIASVSLCIIENMKYLDSLYMCFITSLTIGYGDFSPKTDFGKILIVIFGHFWIFLIIPSIISHILDKLIKDRDEFTHHEQEELKQKINSILTKLNEKGS